MSAAKTVAGWGWKLLSHVLPMKFFSLIVFATVAAAGTVMAQEGGPVEPASTPAASATAASHPAQAAVEAFFASLKANEVDKAFDELLKGSKIAEVAKDVTMLKSKTREAIKFAGAIVGADLLEVRNVGEHLQGYTYISLGRHFPLRWRFYFYKTGGEWKLIDIRISDRLSEMFKEEEEKQ